MRSGDTQQRLIRRYEQLLRAEVANARRRPGRARRPVAGLTPDVATTIAAARKAAGKAAERRLA